MSSLRWAYIIKSQVIHPTPSLTPPAPANLTQKDIFPLPSFLGEDAVQSRHTEQLRKNCLDIENLQFYYF